MTPGACFGRVAPVSPAIELTLDSARTNWAGVRLFVRYCGKRGECEPFRRPDSLVAVVNRGQCDVQLDAPLRRISSRLYPGSLFTMPPGYCVSAMRWTGAHEQTVVTFPPEMLAELAPEVARRPLMRLPLFGVSDIMIESMVAAMRHEIEEGCPSGKLFGESLSMALLARLASPGCFSRRASSVSTQSTFTAVQRERIQAYIDAHLSDDLSLVDLAKVVEVSPGHFSRLFRNTYAVPAYHFVILRRIEEAKRMMAAGGQSILEIALSLGFSSQSHFTATFRKVTGTTPRRFQAML